MKREDPETKQMMERMKWEVAKELGIRFPVDGYWGKMTAKDCGKIGSIVQKRVHAILEHQLGEGRFTSKQTKSSPRKRTKKNHPIHK